MKKEVKEYRMFPYIDITFVRCAYKQEDGAPIITVVAKEPDKFLRIIPFYDETSFKKYIQKFVDQYDFSAKEIYGRMLDIVVIDNENTEYKIICGDKSVSFTAEYDVIRGSAIVTRTDFENYPPIEDEM